MKTLQETETFEDAEMVVKEGAQLINAYYHELFSTRYPISRETVLSMVQDFARLYWLKSIGLEELEFGEDDA